MLKKAQPANWPTDELREFTIIGLEQSIARQQELLDSLTNGHGKQARVSKVARAMERTWNQKNGHGALKLKGLNIRDAVLTIIAHEPTNKEGVVTLLKASKVTKNIHSMGSAMSALSGENLIERVDPDKRGGPWKLTSAGETAAAAIGTR